MKYPGLLLYKQSLLTALLLAWLTLLGAIPLLAAPANFTEAKKVARQHVYHDQAVQGELYCNCPFRWTGASGGRLDLAACGYHVRAQRHRAERIEWEHVVPVSQIARQWQCWDRGGRNHCSATDPDFARMEADLHNLLPVSGELNADRSNFRFAMLPHIENQYGSCHFKVDFKGRAAEPPDAIKGMVARIHFYMADTYQLQLSKQQRQLLDSWHRLYPVNEWERERDRRIARITGTHNPYVSGRTLATNLGAVDVSSTSVIGNLRSKRYHYSHCSGARTTSASNQKHFISAHHAEQEGYTLARNCSAR